MRLFSMSVMGGIMIIIVIMIRAIFAKRLPRRIFPVLWAVVLIRLLIPYNIELKWSIYTYARPFVEEITKDTWKDQQNTTASGLEQDFSEKDNFEKIKQLETINIYYTGHIVFLAGFIIFSMYFIVSYFLCIKRFQRSDPVVELWIQQWKKEHPLKRNFQIRCSDQIKVPLTFGIISPVILLPKEILKCEKQEITFILQHEYIHIRRWDGLLKLLLAASICVHWFNPFVWIMQRLCEKDLEYACDEKVVENLDNNAKKAYALTLFCIEQKKAAYHTRGIGFAATNTEKRIKGIKNAKNRTEIKSFLEAVIGCIFALFLAVVFSTSSVALPQPEKIKFEEKFEAEDREVPIKIIDKAFTAIKERWGEDKNYYLIRESILYFAERQGWTVLLKLYDGQYTYAVNYVTAEKPSATCVIYREEADAGSIENYGYFNSEKNLKALKQITEKAEKSYFVEYYGFVKENKKKYYIYASMVEGRDKQGEGKTERMYWEPYD